MATSPEPALPTPPIIDVSYRVEGADQTNASIAFFLTKGRFLLFMLGMFVALQLWVSAMRLMTNSLDPSAVVLPLCVALVVLAILYLPRLQLRRLSEAERQVRFRISEQGLEILGGVSQSRIDWEAITGISVMKRGALFHFTMSPSVFLSGRHMTAQDHEAVKQWAAWHKPAKRTSMTPWVVMLWLLLVAFFVVIYNIVAS